MNSVEVTKTKYKMLIGHLTACVSTRNKTRVKDIENIKEMKRGEGG